MKLIPFEKFAALRLRPYCIDDDHYMEYEDEHEEIVVEAIRGVLFQRISKKSAGLFRTEFSLTDYSTDVASRFFDEIGLELAVGMTRSNVDTLFPRVAMIGEDPNYVVYETDPPRYHIACGFEKHCLFQIAVTRTDVTP